MGRCPHTVDVYRQSQQCVDLMGKPTFRQATQALCLSAPALSAMFGVPAQSIRQAKLDPSKRGYRPAPAGWEAVLAKIARQRGKEMEALARALEAELPDVG